MNAGLANLDTLKKHLLPQSMPGEIRFDQVIADMGRGVAGEFEKFCNRKFAREVGATFVCTADRDQVYLDRYPVEVLTSVELKTSQDVGWEVQQGLVFNRDDASGQVYWGAQIGYSFSQLRFTFTGGFWFETLEPDDAAYPSAMPAGATALPAELKHAWLLQCRAAWQTLDKLGVDLLTTGSSFVTGTLSTLDLVPAVKRILVDYRRLQLI